MDLGKNFQPCQAPIFQVRIDQGNINIPPREALEDPNPRHSASHNAHLLPGPFRGIQQQLAIHWRVESDSYADKPLANA